MKLTPPSPFMPTDKCSIPPRQIPGFANGNSQANEHCSSFTDLPVQDIRLHQTTIIQPSTPHCHLAPLKSLNTLYKAR